MTAILGIDPGGTGALCLLDGDTENVFFLDMPPIRTTSVRDGYLWIKEALFMFDPQVYLEDVHSIYGASAKSNFGFGKSVGKIQTMLDCIGVDYELIQPKKWQKIVNAPTRKFLCGQMDLKTAMADMAQALYPKAELHGPKGGLKDGRSDALLIAHAGRILHSN